MAHQIIICRRRREEEGRREKGKAAKEANGGKECSKKPCKHALGFQGGFTLPFNRHWLEPVGKRARTRLLSGRCCRGPRTRIATECCPHRRALDSSPWSKLAPVFHQCRSSHPM